MVFPFGAMVAAVSMARKNNDKTKEIKTNKSKIKSKRPKNGKIVTKIIVCYDDGTSKLVENGMVFQVLDEEAVAVSYKNILREDIENIAKILTNEECISKILK